MTTTISGRLMKPQDFVRHNHALSHAALILETSENRDSGPHQRVGHHEPVN